MLSGLVLAISMVIGPPAGDNPGWDDAWAAPPVCGGEVSCEGSGLPGKAAADARTGGSAAVSRAMIDLATRATAGLVDDEDLEEVLERLADRARELEREVRGMRGIIRDILDEHGDEIAGAVEEMIDGFVHEFAPPDGRDRRFRTDRPGPRVADRVRRWLHRFEGRRGDRDGPSDRMRKHRVRIQSCPDCRICPRHRVRKEVRKERRPDAARPGCPHCGRASRKGLSTPGHGKKPKARRFHPGKGSHRGKIIIERDGRRIERDIDLDGSHGLRLMRPGDLGVHEGLLELDIGTEMQVETTDEGEVRIIIEEEGKPRVIDLGDPTGSDDEDLDIRVVPERGLEETDLPRSFY